MLLGRIFTKGGTAMPFGDRTGPVGLGPMTGRGLGRCAGAWPGGRSGGYRGRAGAFGWGRGRGWRHGYLATGLPGWAGTAGGGGFGGPRYSPWTPQDELNYLKDYTLGLEEALNAAKARMIEIEKGTQTE
jgi:hypothetical protein